MTRGIRQPLWGSAAPTDAAEYGAHALRPERFDELLGEVGRRRSWHLDGVAGQHDDVFVGALPGEDLVVVDGDAPGLPVHVTDEHHVRFGMRDLALVVAVDLAIIVFVFLYTKWALR